MSRKDFLRQPSLLALLGAEVVSTTGTQMTWLALPWFVLVTTGSATQTSFVMAAELVGLAFAVLLAVAFGLGALSAPYFAAQKVIVPELLGEDETKVGEANALFQAATRTTLLLGPALGGVLIGVMGATSVLILDAGSYVISVLLVASFVPRRPPLEQDPEHRKIRAGLRFLLRDPLLRVWWPVFAIGDAAWTAFFITIPVLVIARFGHDPKIAGWLFASFGVGAVIGNAIAFRFLLRRMEGLALISVFIMGQALPLWFLWLPLPAAGIAAVILVSGIANGLVNPPLHTISTLRVPASLRPTVMTTAMVLWALVNPLGLFIAGPVLDAFGTTPVLIGFAAVQTVSMAAAGLAAVRERGRRRLVPAAQAG